MLRTPLHALHVRHGAKMVPFAGYEMPLQYPAGLMREHLHTREAAGLFDVSHMGQIAIVPHSGDLAEAARALEALVPIDVLGLPVGRQRYGFLTHDDGGILDDLMVANLGDLLIVTVNAANKRVDLTLIHRGLGEICEVDLIPRALIALQGPQAVKVLERLAPEADAMRFMDARDMKIGGAPCLVTRSGYTGEDGFEISVPEDAAEALAEALLADERVLPVGLGARDSLRLEAGLCLHGADIDPTTPVEAALGWAIPMVRRSGGARAGGFPGAPRILGELDDAAVILLREAGEGDHAKHGGGGGRRSSADPAGARRDSISVAEAHAPPPPPSAVPLPRFAGEDTRRRVGLRPEGRAPVRAGALLFATDTDTTPIGTVTSGGFGPSVGAPVAMGYVPASLAAPGTRLFAEVRGKRLPVAISNLPFVPPGFKRG